jgi:LuxR family maltose regulon positive regulatory protein
LLSGRGAVELWSGHLDEAARVLDSAAAAATTAGGEYERADCLGHLALAEALRGRLRRAVKLASRATAAVTDGRPAPAARHPSSAALVALASAHLERNELREAGGRLRQARAALDASPDKLISAVACLVAAGGSSPRAPRAAAAMVRQARCGWSVPPWSSSG